MVLVLQVVVVVAPVVAVALVAVAQSLVVAAAVVLLLAQLPLLHLPPKRVAVADDVLLLTDGACLANSVDATARTTFVQTFAADYCHQQCH